MLVSWHDSQHESATAPQVAGNQAIKCFKLFSQRGRPCTRTTDGRTCLPKRRVKFKLEIINLFSEPKTQDFFETGNLGEVNDYGTRLFGGVTVKF